MVRRRKKVLIGILIFILVVLLSAIGAYAYIMHSGKNGAQVTMPEGVSFNEDDPLLKNRVSVLLIGADQRPGEESFNTDSIILASIDPDAKRISLLSIPRDTKIEFNGKTVKINAVASLSDLQTLQQTVSNLTGVPISGYIQTNFDGFKSIIDTLGGITVDVEKDMYYVTGDKEDGVINLKKGVQKLDGAKALQYARFRHDALADISRTARQQKVLKAVADEMLQVSTIPKIPTLIPQLKAAVHTNLALADMINLAKVAVEFNSTSVISQTLPGGFLDEYGVSYWNVDPDQVKQVVSNLFQGITTDQVIKDSTIDITKPVASTPPKSNPPKSNPPKSNPTGSNQNSNTGNTIPVVPGNSEDPNGQASPGHNDSPSGNKSSGQSLTGNTKTLSDKSSSNNDSTTINQTPSQETSVDENSTSGNQTIDNQSSNGQITDNNTGSSNSQLSDNGN